MGLNKTLLKVIADLMRMILNLDIIKGASTKKFCQV